MANVKTYRDLVAWQRGMELAVRRYEVTESMPSLERFVLTEQIRRSAVSVPSNIAEGFGRETRANLLKFLRIARGSLNELTTQLELARRLKMLKPTAALRSLVSEVDRVLQSLIRSLQRIRTS